MKIPNQDRSTDKKVLTRRPMQCRERRARAGSLTPGNASEQAYIGRVAGGGWGGGGLEWRLLVGDGATRHRYGCAEAFDISPAIQHGGEKASEGEMGLAQICMWAK